MNQDLLNLERRASLVKTPVEFRMDVTEQIEEPRTVQTPLADVASENVSRDVVSSKMLATPIIDEKPVAAPAWVIPNRAWLRLAYIFEFWLALLVVFTAWSQVGGQGHMDLIAWYIKLVCTIAWAWSAVKMTRGIVENARAWNGSTVRWFLAVVAISTIIAGITYWYHLHEVTDDPDTDENSAAAVTDAVSAQVHLTDLIGRGRQHC